MAITEEPALSRTDRSVVMESQHLRIREVEMRWIYKLPLRVAIPHEDRVEQELSVKLRFNPVVLVTSSFNAGSPKAHA